MDITHRLMRKAIETAVRKALNDMGENSARSIRGLIDLGLFFSSTDNQKWFFNTAHEVIRNNGDSYIKLFSGMTERVDHETLTVSGINLGYNSLVYGAKKLRKVQAETGMSMPWLLLFEADKEGERMIPFANEMILQGSGLGIYFYAVRSFRESLAQEFSKLAANYTECVFMIDIPCSELTDESAGYLAQAHNIIIAVRIPQGKMPASKECVDAFRLLRDRKCLYGFIAEYSDSSLNEITSLKYIGMASKAGCCFGLYRAAADASDECREELYRRVYESRYGNGESVALFEFRRDLYEIGEKLLSLGGYMTVSSSFCGENTSISLPEVLRHASNTCMKR